MILNKLLKPLLITFIFLNILNAQTTKWRVIWEANPDSENVDYYEIYLGTDSNSVNLVDTVNHPNVEFRDSLGIGGQGLQQGQIYYYRIKAVNDSGIPSSFSKAAYASIPEITFSQLSLPVSIDTTFSLNQSQFVNDPDHGISQLEWEVEDIIPGDLIQDSLINPYTINFITPSDTTIQDLLLFRVFDSDSFYAEDSVTISLTGIIIPVNLPPVVSNIPDQTIEQGETFTTFDLDNYVTDADNDTSELTWSASGESNLNVNIDVNSHIVNITPNNPAWTGSEDITFRATDPFGLFDEDAAVFSISLPGNIFPEFTSEPDESAITGELYSYLATAYDQDGDSLTFTLESGSPNFLSVIRNDNTTDTSAFIRGTPPIGGDSIYNVTIRVSDGIGGGFDTQEYELTVTSSPIENISKIVAYPTPFILSKSTVRYITFSNLPLNSQLVLYNLLGEPVFSAKVDSQPYLWYIKNNSGSDVQSGLYFYYVKEGSKILSSGKVVIIR